MKNTTTDKNNLRALLLNKSAVKHMDTKSIANIVDSIKKDYEDRFMDILTSLPLDIVPSVILALSYKSQKEILPHLGVDFLSSIFELATNDEIKRIMAILEQTDEGKFQKLFEILKFAEYDATRNNQPSSTNNNDFSNVKLYYISDNKIKCVGFDDSFGFIETKNLIWIDAFKANSDEIEAIEKILGIEIPSVNEREEIEVSSRYWEENGVTTINSYFTIFENDEVISETVSLILKDDFVVSIRFRNFKSFDELHKRLILTPNNYINGSDLLLSLLDIRIDIDADMLEKMVKDIATLRKDFILDKIANTEILINLSKLEDLNIKMRETLQDKNRILNSLIKNKILNASQVSDLRIMIKDVVSLIVHVDFNFERLDSIQSIALASINIKQGRNITILTIANILFLPPTLIASLYGMNFAFMPELSWEYGYVWALGLMSISAIAPYWLFKTKGWL